jgi:hypothetical protein
MPPRIDPTSAGHYREKKGIVDRNGDDLFQSASDRLPLQVAVPAVIALNLSLWLGIGLVVRAFL